MQRAGLSASWEAITTTIEKDAQMNLITRFTALTVVAAFALPGIAAAQEGDTSQTQVDVVGLASAIETARGELQGGVLDAELEAEDDALVYEVEIVSDGALHEAIIDARSGDLLSTVEQTIEGTWRGWFDADRLDAAATASDGLTDALAAAEKQFGGRVTEASLEEEDDMLYWELEISTEAGDQEAVVNAQTGEVMAGEVDD
jgi:uncharacterized membrane protein YkoI